MSVAPLLRPKEEIIARQERKRKEDEWILMHRPWYEFIMPWEIPSKWHPIRYHRWKMRHRRISVLEDDLDLSKLAYRTSEYSPMYYKIWGDPYGGY
jgi:hypothetical protein